MTKKSDACRTREQLNEKILSNHHHKQQHYNSRSSTKKEKKEDCHHERKMKYKWPADEEFPYFPKSYTEIKPDNTCDLKTN